MAGLWYEDFVTDMVFEHEWTRTITETDNRWFSLLTMNTQPVHISVAAAAKTVWKKPLVNSLFTLGCMVGMTVNDTTFGTTVANLGMTDVKFPHPLFEGDTIRMKTIVLGKRESKSRAGEGIVNLRHECYNQDDVLVGTCDRAALMMKRPVAA
jgi:acyl dehydratase